MVEPHVGGLVSHAPPCYVSGRRRVVVGFGKSLRGYVFDPNPQPSGVFTGHEAPVIAVVAVANMRVASASIDGTVRVWGVADAELLRTIDCAHPLRDMKPLNDGRVVVATNREVCVLSLERSSNIPERVEVIQYLDPAPNRRVSTSRDGSTIATISQEVLSIAFVNGDRISVLNIEGHGFASVAVSEDGYRLALGHNAGYIKVFMRLNQMRVDDGQVHWRHVRDLPKYWFTTFHWHPSHVVSLCFSKNGSILYSGGLEGVLVAWKLSRTDFGRKNFVPRLGGAIWGIGLSEDDSEIALTLANNSFRFIDRVSLYSATSIRGLSTAHFSRLPPWSVSKKILSPNKFIRMFPEPGSTGCALVAGIGNTVQLYDVLRGMSVAEFQIIPRNISMSGERATKERKEKKSFKQPSVSLIAVSPDLKYMASVSNDIHPKSESILCGNTVFVETLKFWEYHGGRGRNRLLSVLENPHGEQGSVVEIAFHPNLPILVTSSSCGTFKIWRAVCTDREGDNSELVWRCEAVHKYRGMACGSVAFSSDGSVLSVSFMNVITVWVVEDYVDTYAIPYVRDNLIGMSSPVSLELTFMHALIHPPMNEPVGHLSFVMQQSGLLLATTCHGLYIWDVLNQSIQWSIRLVNRPEFTVADPLTGRFALVVKLESDSLAMPTAVTDDKPMRNVREKEKSKKKSKEKPTKKRPKVRSFTTDTAVAVFDVNSAVPKSVTILPVGTDVAGIGFVGDERVGKSLFCFDDTMEIVSVPNDDVGENISKVTDIPKSPAESNMIGDLVGTDVVKSDSVFKASNDLPLSFVEKAPFRNVLKKYMDGSGVTQPIITNIATPMLKALSRIVHDSVTDGREGDMALIEANVSEEEEETMDVDDRANAERIAVEKRLDVDDRPWTFDLKKMSALFETMAKSD